MKSPRIPALALVPALCLLAGAASAVEMRRPGMEELDDESIRKSVEEAFRRDPRVRDQEIQVRVADGIVTLAGSASDLAVSREATELAAEVTGVLAVNSNLSVSTRGRSDGAIESGVLDRLRRNASVPHSRITVTAAGGVVTLAGRVDEPAARLFAAREAARVPGVIQVVNKIQVPGEPDEAVQRRVRRLFASGEGALKGLSGNIEASVSKGTVILTGRVKTLARKLAVEQSVMAQRGVTGVINSIEVDPSLDP